MGGAQSTFPRLIPKETGIWHGQGYCMDRSSTHSFNSYLLSATVVKVLGIKWFTRLMEALLSGAYIPVEEGDAIINNVKKSIISENCGYSAENKGR